MSLQELSELTYFRGRVALHAILQGLGIGPRDDVLTQAYTCVAVPEGIMAGGARPVFVDITQEGYTLDPDQLADRITPRTRAIVVQHTFGIPANMQPIMAFARHHHLAVIEDCCHTLTSTFQGQRVGTFGDAAFYSFEYGKPFAIGAGGAAIVNADLLRQRMRDMYHKYREPSLIMQMKIETQAFLFRTLYSPRLYWTLKRSFHLLSQAGFAAGNYHKLEPGVPSAEFQTKMGRLAHRRLVASLNQAPVLHSPDLIYGPALRELNIIQPVEQPDGVCAYVRYPVRVRDKQAVTSLAAQHRVEVADWYRTPIHPLSEAECRQVGYEPGSCPNAEQRAREALTLPLRGRITRKYVDDLTDILRRAG